MVLIDLTHPVQDGMPVWPGDPAVRLRPAARIPTAGYNLLALELGSQTGTHVDAPFHVDDHLPRLDELPLERFAGPAVVADLRHLAAGVAIGAGDLDPVRPRLRPGTVLLLCTGWSRHWGTEEYSRHPWLSPTAAQVVLDAGVRTLGIDAPSVDASAAGDAPPDLPTHRLLAQRHAVIAENLTNLEAVLAQDHLVAQVSVWLLPLALAGADGAPVRAVAQVAARLSGWT